MKHIVLFSLLFLISGSSAHPLNLEQRDPGTAYHDVGDSLIKTHDHSSNLASRSLPAGLSIVGLEVGDSITKGVVSSDGNGYRLNLINMIKQYSDITPWFIGTQVSGAQDNNDPFHEGYPSARISTIQANLAANNILAQQPNLVLIHTGTNDNEAEMIGESYADAPARLGNLIDFVICHDPNAVIIVAQLIGSNWNQTQTDLFNAEVPSVVQARTAKGYRVQTVDMSSIRGNNLGDLVHPNDNGYWLMAYLWYGALINIPADWWNGAVSASPASDGTCH